MKVKSESEVAQSRPTPSDPMDCSLPRLLHPWDFSRQEYWSGVPLPFPKMSTREHNLGDGVVLYTIRAVVVTEHCMFVNIH